MTILPYLGIGGKETMDDSFFPGSDSAIILYPGFTKQYIYYKIVAK